MSGEYCRCQGGNGGARHVLGSGACEYPRPRTTALAGGSRAVQVGPRPRTLDRMEHFIIRGSSGEAERAEMLKYWEEVKADYQRRLIRQSNRISVLTDDLIIARDVQDKMRCMIEELLEQEIPDVDPTIYLRRLRRLTEGSNADEE